MTMIPDQAALDAAIGREPDLNAWGLADRFTCARNDIDQAKAEVYREEPRSSEDAIEMFRRCCDYLKLCFKTEKINRRVGSSCGLKHCVEHWSGWYVTNGSFIAALIHMGIPYKRIPDSPNVWMALSPQLPMGSHRPSLWVDGEAISRLDSEERLFIDAILVLEPEITDAGLLPVVRILDLIKSQVGREAFNTSPAYVKWLVRGLGMEKFYPLGPASHHVLIRPGDLYFWKREQCAVCC
jgi:hypothetical protein